MLATRVWRIALLSSEESKKKLLLPPDQLHLTLLDIVAYTLSLLPTPLPNTITLHSKQYFPLYIRTTKKKTTNCSLHIFSTFFSFIYDVNMFLFSLFIAMKQICSSTNSFAKKHVPSFTLYYLKILPFSLFLAFFLSLIYN